MRRIAIVGAGQSGLQLALGLLKSGYEVTLVSNRSAADIAAGPVMSSQCMFETALQAERQLGLNYWDDECPPVEGMRFCIGDGQAAKAVEWAARLDHPAQSVDQRLKMPVWLDEFARLGGELVIKEAEVGDLDDYSRSHDLVIVASGKGQIGRLFERDARNSPYDKPQRALALTYVRGMEPAGEFPAVSFNIAPGVGEYFSFPGLTTSGPCQIMTFEGVPQGPMDCWEGVQSPEEHLETSVALLEKFFPWEAERCRRLELADDNARATGRYTPVVRRPVALLPSGRFVLGMADVVVLNDPITGQGSNNAAKCAEIYLDRIVAHGEQPFDAEWAEDTFEQYWRGYAQWVTWWTNSMLAPPASHVDRILTAAAELPDLAATIVNGFDDPLTLYPWWFDAGAADRLLEHERAKAASSFDRRDFRRALGQFATGVTVITTRADDGRKIGMTANSFTSVSLEPPLVLFCLASSAPSRSAFEQASHFAIHVLAANQHGLSRQFATPSEDKFSGVDYTEGPGGVPLLDGVIARFVCRNETQFDGGDHVIFLGEVENYERFDGEPLVFHSGFYRVATRHPEISD